MTHPKRYPYAEALEVAQKLKDALASTCCRIEITGSLRRHKPDVGDIELLFVPREGQRQLDLLSQESYSLADELIAEWVRKDLIAQRPNVKGCFTWGPKNKLAIHTTSGIPLDLFATTERNWWVSLVVRTGGKATNLRLAMGAQRIGRSLNAYGSGVTCSDRSIIPATSEKHVFELCGVPYLEPEERP